MVPRVRIEGPTLSRREETEGLHASDLQIEVVDLIIMEPCACARGGRSAHKQDSEAPWAETTRDTYLLQQVSI